MSSKEPMGRSLTAFKLRLLDWFDDPEKRKLVVLLLVALLIRLALLPFTIHVDPNFVSDAITYNVDAWRMGQPGWRTVLYPPLTFYTAAAFLFPMMALLSG